MTMERRSLPQLCVHMLRGRWVVAVVSLYILAFSGATYIFGIYSGAIKESLNYNQETIDTLSFFKDLGANVGIISGLLNEVTPAWFLLAVGACMNMFGYLMIWLAVTHKISRPRVWQVYLYMCLGANSQTFANTGALVTCVKNFPHKRGVVLGVLKGFVGLSGAIFTQIYYALYGEDTRGVILLVGWLPSLISLMFMFFVRPMTPSMDKNEVKHFYSFLYLSLFLAGFLMIIIIVENQVGLSSAIYKVMGAITVFLVAANLWIGVRAEVEPLRQQQDESNVRVRERSSGIHPSDDKIKKKHALFPSQENAPPCEVSKTLATAPTCSSPALSESLISSGPTNDEFHHLPGASGDAKTASAAEDKKPSDIEDKNPSDSQTQIESGPTTPSQPKERNVIDVHKRPNGSTRNADIPRDLQRFSWLQRAENVRLVKRFTAFYSNWPERGDDFTIPQALVSLDMCILFVSLTCGVGATLTAIDNMGQIGESQGYSKISISTFISLISIWNFLGRVLAGVSSEILLKRFRFPRTLTLTIILGMACVGHLLIAFPTPGSLYVASIIVGFCFGAQWPILYAVISELFGLKYYATLYNLGAVASPLGSYLLNVRVAGYLYDREARRQLAELLSSSAASPHAPAAARIASSDLTCVGSRCFREAFLIMTGASLLGSLISLILVVRTRKFYSQDIYARFRKPTNEEPTIERTVPSEL